jgi:hypothetical protein
LVDTLPVGGGGGAFVVATGGGGVRVTVVADGVADTDVGVGSGASLVTDTDVGVASARGGAAFGEEPQAVARTARTSNGAVRTRAP